MKFLVDQLPYYNEFCPLSTVCWYTKCPRYWDKEKVCSDDNPHECLFLVETSIDSAKSDDHEDTEDHCCGTCKHFGGPYTMSICAICIGHSNWEAKQFKHLNVKLLIHLSEVQELNPDGQLAPIVAVEKGD